MFSEQYNIQGRHTPIFYLKRGSAIRSWAERTTQTATLIAVTLFLAVTQGQPASDGPALVSAALNSAIYFLAVVQGQDASDGPGYMSAACTEAIYFLSVVQGQDASDGPGSMSALFTNLVYFLAIFQGAPAGGADNNATQSAALTSVVYA